MFFCLGHSFSQENKAAETNIEYYFEKARDLGNRNKTELALEDLNTAMEIAFKNNDQKALIDTYHKFAILYLRLQKLHINTLMPSSLIGKAKISWPYPC